MAAGNRDPKMTLAYGEVESESLRDAIAATSDQRAEREHVKRW